MPERKDNRAILVRETEKGCDVSMERLGAIPQQGGDVSLQVKYSSINYKDALAVTGKGPVLRHFPMVPGIDVAGVIQEVGDKSEFDEGCEVFVTGWGLGEKYSGGFASEVFVRPEWLLPIPEGLNAKEVMGIGTAGLTAMLSIMALEQQGLEVEQGPILVTGATGGVGSMAIHLLSQKGYEVVASTGKVEEEAEYLKKLGADRLIHRDELSVVNKKPLESTRWAGAVDSVGGGTLGTIIKQIQYRGSISACGLAGGTELHGSVFPFILRGVRLLGIDSVMCPIEERQQAWGLLEKLICKELLNEMIQVVDLEGVLQVCQSMMQGSHRGRTVVRV